ncbi:hypothetical protein [Micromonospora sp. NBS 11-29]|uniref:hypothetical protein n=1 Tax=Micromonospora sp. NBS 11-29 TaxID=1960879 RepID=UPI000B776F55|nr:hypothetical protein [Micromonospora sp. NBS 11-29]
MVDPDGSDRGAAGTPVPVLAPAAQLGKGASREQRQQANQQRRARVAALTGRWLARMVAADPHRMDGGAAHRGGPGVR